MSGLGTFSATSRNRAAALGSAREKDDFYRTPASATEELLRAEVLLPHRIWEPACGDGAISRVLESHGHEVVSTDLVDRGYGTARRDFLMERELPAPCIVTNPPFKLADEFVLHALDIGAETVCMFMRLAWLEGRARHARLWSKHPPARIWTFAARQTLWRGDDPNAQTTGGAIAFAWFVWTRGHSGAPALGWIA